MPKDFWFAVSWSLSIEEWFYFTFGAAIVSLSIIFGQRKGIFLAVELFLIAPLLVRIFDPMFPIWDSGHVKMVPFRLDEIAYGIVVAILYRAKNPIVRYHKTLLALGLRILAVDWLLQWLNIMILPFRVYCVLQPTVTILGSVLACRRPLNSPDSPPLSLGLPAPLAASLMRCTSSISPFSSTWSNLIGGPIATRRFRRWRPRWFCLSSSRKCFRDSSSNRSCAFVPHNSSPPPRGWRWRGTPETSFKRSEFGAMVSPEGFEPSTPRLKVSCSTS